MDNKSALGIVCGQLNKRQNTRQAIIAMSSSFVNLRAKSGSFDRLLIDECFSGDTLISTPFGDKRIDLVRCGDSVYNAIGIGIVDKTSIKPSIENYLLEFSNGTTTECTREHPFFTQRGWKKVWELEKGDYFYSIKDLSKLWESVQALDEYYRWKNNKLLQSKNVGEAAFLLRVLCEEVAEPYEQSSIKIEDESETKRNKSQAYKTRRERVLAIFSTACTSSRIRGRLGSGIGNQDAQRPSQWSVAELLQGGYSERKNDDRNRDRRGESLHSRKTIEGYKEDDTINRIRLVNVSVIKRESATPVYNLSISGHPSYFADGKLVHNCHRLQVRPGDQKPAIIQKIITSLLRINPDMKVCGVTGTPYRPDQGMLHEESIKSVPFFTDLVYDSYVDPGIKRLIEEGYLSHIEVLNSPVHVDLTGVKMSGTEYNADAAGVKFDEIIDGAVVDMRDHFDRHNIQTAIIFTSNLTNARHIMQQWGDSSTMRIVCGDESLCTKAQRKDAIEWIKSGSGRRYILNVDILCEGFDHKALECVVLLRATTSPGLLVQMVGRVIRPHNDKKHGYLIDYGTNLARLTNGGIEDIITPKPKKRKGDTPKKPCLAMVEETVVFEELTYRSGDECGYPNLLSAKKCKVCGAEFISEGEEGNYSMRTASQALKLKQDALTKTYEVAHVTFDEYLDLKRSIMHIKINFYDEFMGHIANDILWFKESGGPADRTTSAIMSMLKDKKKYGVIAKFEGGVCVKSMMFLFGDEYRTQFFRDIKTVTVTKEGRFDKVLSWGF
jgi:superfamily II DNA or RNA helicase